MINLEDVRAHVLALKTRRVRMIGHRAMLARALDEIDALTAALSEARLKTPSPAEVLQFLAVMLPHLNAMNDEQLAEASQRAADLMDELRRQWAGRRRCRLSGNSRALADDRRS